MLCSDGPTVSNLFMPGLSSREVVGLGRYRKNYQGGLHRAEIGKQEPLGVTLCRRMGILNRAIERASFDMTFNSTFSSGSIG